MQSRNVITTLAPTTRKALLHGADWRRSGTARAPERRAPVMLRMYPAAMRAGVGRAPFCSAATAAFGTLFGYTWYLARRCSSFIFEWDQPYLPVLKGTPSGIPAFQPMRGEIGIIRDRTALQRHARISDEPAITPTVLHGIRVIGCFDRRRERMDVDIIAPEEWACLLCQNTNRLRLPRSRPKNGGSTRASRRVDLVQAVLDRHPLSARSGTRMRVNASHQQCESSER
jgi:hypothetical protein